MKAVSLNKPGVTKASLFKQAEQCDQLMGEYRKAVAAGDSKKATSILIRLSEVK